MSNRILIVEDEPLIAEDLSMILTKEGYKIVGIAHGGSEALDLLHSQSPDLVLLDIALDSAMSGFDVAHVINDKYKVPFIFITSFSDKYTLDRAKEVSPAGYIIKPFKKRDVSTNVALVLHKRTSTSHSIFKSIEQINASMIKPISDKEYILLRDIARGKTNQELCDTHHISMNTVKTHLKRMFTKMDVNSRTQAVAKILKD